MAASKATGGVPPIEPTPPVAPPAAPPVPPAAPAAPTAPPVPPAPAAAARVDPYSGATPMAPAPPVYQVPAGYQVPPGYQGAPGYQQGPGYYGQPQPPRGLSITSMVLGIVGVFFSLFYGLGLFPSIAALITSLLARTRQPQGRGFWMAGLITGIVGIVLSLIGVALLVFVIIAVTTNGFGTGVTGSDYGDY